MQATERPVFRQDLVAEAIEEQGARYIDVADPDSGHMFRFFEVEYAIACAMDGQRDVAGIVKWAQEELGVTPSPKEVQTVIATLADLRFIETGATRLSDVPEAKVAAQQPNAFRDEHNEATTVGAQALPDDDLAPGIVVGKQAPAAASGAGAQFELGSSGAAGSKAPEAPLPKADFDLGAPGAAASTAAKQVKTPAEDIALGAPGAKAAPAGKAPAADLSMDLASEMPIKAADVKEAVRASKVMTAVEVPKELQDELDKPAKQPEKKPADKAAEKAAEKKPEKVADKAAEKPAAVAAKSEKPTEKSPAAKAGDKKAEKQPEKKAVALPAKPAEKHPVAPPAPEQKISPVLIVLLILAAVGAGAFFFWKFVLAKPEAEPQTKVAPPTPPAPPPPAVVASAIALETPPAQDIKSPVGTIETVEPTDKDVKTGDVLATLVGAKALTTEIEKLRADVDKATATIEAATKELSDAQQKENNQAGVTAAQAKLDRIKKPIEEKKATITKKQGDLDKLVIKATTDGKLATTAKVGQKVAADEVIAKITRATVPVATFKIPPGTKVGADGNVSLSAAEGKSVVCTVSDAQAETIKVTCPADSGLPDGATVKFTLPK